MFSRCTVRVGKVSTTYQLFVPRNLGARAPVVLFLHGAGESGSDGEAQTTVGMGPAIRAHPDRFPALVVMPQASHGYGWSGFNLAAAAAALDDVIAKYDCDVDRVSITGISMGGYGVWTFLLRAPDLFSAAVPICGGLALQPIVDAGDIERGTIVQMRERAARRIAHVPHWIFHGDADDIIPVEHSREMVDALRAAGATPRYTEYAGVGHNSWDRAYADPELMPWLLAQRRAT